MSVKAAKLRLDAMVVVFACGELWVRAMPGILRAHVSTITASEWDVVCIGRNPSCSVLRLVVLFIGSLKGE